MKHTNQQWQKKVFLVLCASLSLALGGCTPKVQQEGFPPAAEMKEKLGTAATRQDVLQALGTPSIRNNYGDEVWYYISTQKESHAFFLPEVTRQDVLKITFAADGSVKQADVLDKSAGKDVAMFDKVTPTEGHKLGFAEQVLGNVGRFNSPTSTRAGARPTHSGAIPGGRM